MFKKLWNFVRHILGKLIPEYTVTPLVCTLLFQVVVYSGTKLFMGNATYHNFESALDLATPFLPWTSFLWISWKKPKKKYWHRIYNCHKKTLL